MGRVETSRRLRPDVTRSRRAYPRIAACALTLFACASGGGEKKRETAVTSAYAGPLTAQWQGPWGGVPPFGQFKVADIKPAMERGMADNLADIDRIASNAESPTFENTIAAMERAGGAFQRAYAVYLAYANAMNDSGMQAVQADVEPKLAAMKDRIVQNAKLFGRIAAVYERRDELNLTPEQQRLLWLDYTSFVRQGSKLSAADKEKLSALNQQLATLSTRFFQNVLAEETQMVLLGEKDLEGLSPVLREQAKAAAAARGNPGQWAIVNTHPSVDPFLTFSTRRDLREKVWRMFIMRGDNGDVHDNNAIITEMLLLRARKAKLLGYPTWAHWKLADQMARTPERTLELMEAVWNPAVARVHEQVADMQAIADREGKGLRIEPWDYRFYAEKVRRARYELDESEIKPFLQLEKLREGTFWVAGQLFGLKFVPVADGSVPVYHPDVRVWEVRDASGRHVGLWFFDLYARPGKISWTIEYRRQSRVAGDVSEIVSILADFMTGKPGEPVLISWNDAAGLFHAFGHALHVLISDVTYPSLSGATVAQDYGEFPAQLFEHWLYDRTVLDRFALHVQTGQPIPEALVKKIERSKTFNQGFATVEYLSAALIDMKVHLAGETPIDPRRFERDTLAALGMPREVAMRHRMPHFLHVFASDDYPAGFYSYLWSDTLAADAWEAFVEAGGPYDKAVAARLKEDVFSKGNTADPAEMYRAFRGRDPGVAALMRKRGFAAPE